MTERPSGNLFENLPDDLPEESFQALLETDTVLLERILSTGHATPAGEWYDQPRAEWVVVLRGRAGLRFEDEDAVRTLNPGDHLLIPAHARHRVEWTSDTEPTVWLALHLPMPDIEGSE